MAEVLEVFGGRVLKLDLKENMWNNSDLNVPPDDDLKEQEFLERCPNSKMYAKYIVEEKGKEPRLKMVPLRCKQWSCPFCTKVNASVLYNKIKRGIVGCLSEERRDGFQDDFAVKFLTLTFPGQEYRDATNPQAAEAAMKSSFKKMIAQLRRKLKGRINYAWVVEKQRDGFPHLHVVLIGRAIGPISVLADIEFLWRKQQELGFVRLNAVKGGISRVSGYLSKYITTEIAKGRKGSHVYGMSQGFGKAISDQKPQITMIERGHFDVVDGRYIFTPIWQIHEQLDSIKVMEQFKIEREEVEDFYLQMPLPFGD